MDSENEQLGIVKFEDAAQKARDNEQDLVLVAPQSTPPVCRMMNYGKYLYEKNKKQQPGKTKPTKSKLKEIKFHPNIEEHDFNTKVNHILGFLDKGMKVRVSLFFRGREMAHTDLGYQLLDRVRESIGERGTVDSPKRQGRAISMMVSPVSKK